LHHEGFYISQINMSENTPVSPWLDSTQKPYIQIENVTKKFGDFTAIDNLT